MLRLHDGVGIHSLQGQPVIEPLQGHAFLRLLFLRGKLSRPQTHSRASTPCSCASCRARHAGRPPRVRIPVLTAQAQACYLPHHLPPCIPRHRFTAERERLAINYA